MTHQEALVVVAKYQAKKAKARELIRRRYEAEKALVAEALALINREDK